MFMPVNIIVFHLCPQPWYIENFLRIIGYRWGSST
jgi:hypothetical protein